MMLDQRILHIFISNLCDGLSLAELFLGVDDSTRLAMGEVLCSISINHLIEVSKPWKYCEHMLLSSRRGGKCIQEVLVVLISMDGI